MKNTKLIPIYYNTLTMIANQLDGEIRKVMLETLKKFGIDCNIGNFNYALLCSINASVDDLKEVIAKELHVNFKSEN